MTRNLAALALALGLAATAAWAAKTPHGGTMFAPSAGKHVYHLELVPKDGEKAVIYVLAKDEKTAVPIKDKKFTLSVKGAGKVEFTADPQKSDPEGKASRFTAAASKLPKKIDFEQVEISGLVNGRPFIFKLDKDDD